jgi:hypothetical protein
LAALGDDRSKPPLERRVPGATRAGPASTSRPELPEALLQRMQAVVNAAHARAVHEEEERRERESQPDQAARPEAPTSLPKRVPGTAAGPKPPNGMPWTKLPAVPRAYLSGEDSESDTDPFLPRVPTSGAVASQAASKLSAQPNHTAQANGTAQPDSAAKPDHVRRTDRALRRRDRRAAKRDHAQAEREQAERERSAQAARERVQREQAERERTERERADKEQAARAELERAEREQAERERTERERAEKEQAARAELERAERERTERERAELERAELERVERERAERERAAQAERERAERERTERERAERERAAEAAGAAQAVADRAEQAQRAAPPDQAEPEQRTPSDGAKPDGSAEPDRVAPTVVDQPWRPLGQRKPPTRRRSRTIVLAVGVAALLAAGPLALALSHHGGPKLDAAEKTRNEAAAWVAHQVSDNDVVSCDVTMCLALKAHGVPVGHLLVLGGTHRDIMGSQVVVSTATVRDLFGSRLGSAYAPAVLASFGSGKTQIDVRVVAPDGAGAAYMSALRTDVQQRKSLGGVLAADRPRITLTPTARRQMDAGEVDAQLLIVIGYLATYNPVDVLAFGDSGPSASPGIPLRSATLAENGGAGVVRSMTATLRAQSASYRAAYVGTSLRAGQPVMVIEFDAPGPLGLINRLNQ